MLSNLKGSYDLIASHNHRACFIIRRNKTSISYYAKSSIYTHKLFIQRLYKIPKSTVKNDFTTFSKVIYIHTSYSFRDYTKFQQKIQQTNKSHRRTQTGVKLREAETIPLSLDSNTKTPPRSSWLSLSWFALFWVGPFFCHLYTLLRLKSRLAYQIPCLENSIEEINEVISTEKGWKQRRIG
jgi:hypothetical protein